MFDVTYFYTTCPSVARANSSSDSSRQTSSVSFDTPGEFQGLAFLGVKVAAEVGGWLPLFPSLFGVVFCPG